MIRLVALFGLAIALALGGRLLSAEATDGLCPCGPSCECTSSESCGCGGDAACCCGAECDCEDCACDGDCCADGACSVDGCCTTTDAA